MTRVSKRSLKKERLDEIETYFSELIVFLTQKDTIKDFFSDFLTPEEQTMLAKRLMLFLLIKKGYDTQTIQASLHVSHETVRIYARQLHYKSPRFHDILEALLKSAKTKQMWKNIEKALEPLSLIFQARNNMKARARLASGPFSDLR